VNKHAKTPDALKIVRCAIYTRKSSEEGLEQDFNSLDAQREAGAAYVASQRHEGWTTLPDRYDDGGFTGANTDRPGLRRLLADIGDGKVDCVVVYKVDRLSRSLLDFAQMMKSFDERSVSFVSVTQQFNTATSMGRLILNVLLSFAQFEREIIAERTRDKIAATRRKGKWAGGRPLLGYDLVGSKLVVNDAEAEQVREIFRLYREHGGLLPVVHELEARGWTAKSWQARKGHLRRPGLRPHQPASAVDQRRLPGPGPLQGRSPHGRTRGDRRAGPVPRSAGDPPPGRRVGLRQVGGLAPGPASLPAVRAGHDAELFAEGRQTLPLLHLHARPGHGPRPLPVQGRSRRTHRTPGGR
jgi:DNA invertase Pin-like site-specific DNA recombinase